MIVERIFCSCAYPLLPRLVTLNDLSTAVPVGHVILRPLQQNGGLPGLAQKSGKRGTNGFERQHAVRDLTCTQGQSAEVKRRERKGHRMFDQLSRCPDPLKVHDSAAGSLPAALNFMTLNGQFRRECALLVSLSARTHAVEEQKTGR
ncbi:hypothetical protein CERZMDRAFT_84510 [Cercospora zeae-maydis SCOH1-5]|uniref:Uncharacterized protein n=1 Tax=Cercospora zeae-maydis SCOH1-5 TaxID=717836 RepID=A0A6A6FHH3_9PEZI|nr:hypothetical protein CERZMDRAFT_84510 [Cercospora zeae-maydis SCOH1-5]